MSRSGLFVMLFVFAAGGALGYVAGTSAGDPDPVASGPGPAPPDVPARPAAIVVEGGGPSGEEERLQDFLDEIDVPKVVRGSGVISGSVKLADGSPLAGAVVHATPYARWRQHQIRGGPAPDRSPERLLRVYAERLLTEEGGRVTAKTQSDGTYELPGVGSGQYRIEAWLEGYHLQGSTWRARAGERIEFVAKPVIRLRLTVLMPDGSVPETGASILVRVGSRQESQWWTPEAGGISLEPGQWTVYATCGDNNEYRSEEVEVVVEAGARPDPLTLQLGSRPGIKGRVVFPAGERLLSYCWVKLLKIPRGKDPDPERLKREGMQTTVHTSQSGTFRFHDLAPGTYLIGILGKDRKVVVSDTVEVAGEIVEKDLTYPAPDPNACVLVRVEGPDGKPVTDATFSVGYEKKGRPYYGSGSPSASRLPDGRYRVAHHTVDPKQETPDGRHVLTVATARLGRKRVTYVRTETRELTVRFEEPAMLTVTVLGYAESGHEGQIRLSVGGGGNSRYSTSHSYSGGSHSPRGLSPEGVQKFGPLAPGEYTLALRMDVGGRSTTVATEKLVLGSGPNKAAIGIPAIHSLTVLCGDTRDGVHLYVRSLESPTSGHFSRSGRVKDGQVVFEGVPAGRYKLSASGAVVGYMEIQVQGATTVRFVPKPVNAYLVHITDPGGPFSRAGLREGDLIIGVDGTEFTDSQQMYALMTLATKKDSCTLSVMRGGTVVGVEIDLSKTGIYGGKEAGGRLSTSTR